MSVAKRSIAIDPDTPIREAIELLTEVDDEVEVRIGDRVFVLHERPAEPMQPPIGRTPIESTGTGKGLAAFVGIWDDQGIDFDALKKYIYEMRDYEYDIERERRVGKIEFDEK